MHGTCFLALHQKIRESQSSFYAGREYSREHINNSGDFPCRRRKGRAPPARKIASLPLSS